MKNVKIAVYDICLLIQDPLGCCTKMIKECTEAVRNELSALRTDMKDFMRELKS